MKKLIVLFVLLIYLFNNAIMYASPANTSKYSEGGNGLKNMFIILAIFYFIPSIIAVLRGHYNLIGLMALNLFLGWTIFGWIAALVWSLIRSPKSQNIVISNTSKSEKSDKYSQLEKLNQLKNSGGINDQEYEREKQKLLQ